MDISTMGTVLAIVVITYLIGLLCKSLGSIRDELIPVIVGAAGGVLGIVGMYVIPDFPAKDVLNALAVGIGQPGGQLGQLALAGAAGDFAVIALQGQKLVF